MTDIAQIQALDVSKILNKEVKSEIEKLIEDYNSAEDKEDFTKVTKESSTLILDMIKDLYPDAIVESAKPCVEVVVTPKQEISTRKVIPKKQDSKNNQESKKKPPSKKKSQNKTFSTSSTKDKLQALQEEVEECRKRGKARKSTAKKTPRIPKTVYDKVHNHINAIANLLPERFKDDPEKISDLKKMSLNIHKKVVSVFEMNETLAEKGKLALKEKFKSMNQKIKTDDSK